MVVAVKHLRSAYACPSKSSRSNRDFHGLSPFVVSKCEGYINSLNLIKINNSLFDMTSNIALPCMQNNCAGPQVYTEQRLSIVSIVCRICYDNEKEEPLITPCRCKGTVAFVHRSCLETWLAESNTSTCELCHQIFKTERTPKYSSLKSIWRWVRIAPANQRGARAVKSDLLACGLLTPIAIIITYVCLFSSDYYNQKKFSTIPAARWTSLSLLFMIAIMLIGYYLWVYSVIRLHARMWYNWWQRECVVKYVPPSTINICPTCPSNVNTPHNTPLSRRSSVENITEPCIEPRSHSIFQLERDETEIRNECLGKMDYARQKASGVSGDDISVDMIDEISFHDKVCLSKIENERQKASQVSAEDISVDIDAISFHDTKTEKINAPFTLIKNKGVVHILNFSEPSDLSTSFHERLKAHPFSNISSTSSDSSSANEIEPIEENFDFKTVIENKELVPLLKKVDTGNTDLTKTDNFHHEYECEAKHKADMNRQGENVNTFSNSSSEESTADDQNKK